MSHCISVASSFHRRLPHWNRNNAEYFVTWRLAGSLPTCVMADRFTCDGNKFVRADRLLDACPTGPYWLRRNDIAGAVRDILLRGERDGEYQLGSWVLMPNHVHIIVLPRLELSPVIAAVKARTARQANHLLVRTGQAFWAKDYYDHWIRNRIEEQRIARYIEENPVKAGLCKSAELWPWSSAYPRQTRLAPRVPSVPGPLAMVFGYQLVKAFAA